MYDLAQKAALADRTKRCIVLRMIKAARIVWAEAGGGRVIEVFSCFGDEGCQNSMGRSRWRMGDRSVFVFW